jgi:hypothetical protein
VILPFFTPAVGFSGLVFRSIDIPAVQVEMTGIHQDRSGSGVMMLARVNFARPVKESQRILTDFQVSGMIGAPCLAGLRPVK